MVVCTHKRDLSTSNLDGKQTPHPIKELVLIRKYGVEIHTTGGPIVEARDHTRPIIP